MDGCFVQPCALAKLVDSGSWEVTSLYLFLFLVLSFGPLSVAQPPERLHQTVTHCTPFRHNLANGESYYDLREPIRASQGST